MSESVEPKSHHLAENNVQAEYFPLRMNVIILFQLPLEWLHIPWKPNLEWVSSGKINKPVPRRTLKVPINVLGLIFLVR